MSARGVAVLKVPDHLRDLEALPITMELDDAAKVMCVSVRTLRRWIDDGLVRATRQGGRAAGASKTIVTRSEVIRYFVENPAR